MTAFDLFCTTSEGTEWLATFLNIEVAKSNAELLSTQVPGEYFIVDQVSGNRLFELRSTDSGTPIDPLRPALAKNTSRFSALHNYFR